MSPDQPYTYDAVLGGQHPNSFATAAILGGLEGVKQRLASDKLNLPTKALKDALDYGTEGEALIREYFNHPDHSQFFIRPLAKVAAGILWGLSASERYPALINIAYLLRSGAEAHNCTDQLLD